MDSLHFIYLPIDRYLDCFQILDILHNAASNICFHVFVWTYAFIFLLSEYLGVELLGGMAELKLPNCFPKWLHHFISLPAPDKGPSCATAGMICLLDYSQSSG